MLPIAENKIERFVTLFDKINIFVRKRREKGVKKRLKVRKRKKKEWKKERKKKEKGK